MYFNRFSRSASVFRETEITIIKSPSEEPVQWHNIYVQYTLTMKLNLMSEFFGPIKQLFQSRDMTYSWKVTILLYSTNLKVVSPIRTQCQGIPVSSYYLLNFVCKSNLHPTMVSSAQI
jgi:hypothetical protein